ncbi:hypothetical protein Ancab_005589 [Ancistrocladus abbreviatus]
MKNEQLKKKDPTWPQTISNPHIAVGKLNRLKIITLIWNVKSYFCHFFFRKASKGENGLKGNNKKGVSTSSALDLDAGICGKDAAKNTNLDGELVGETCGRNLLKEGSDDSGWEDGSIPVSDDVENTARHQINGFTIEFNESPDSAKQKPVRRATAEDKEVAQLVHKVHLLCLLARGRLIDRTCNDPIIQAALLSLLPSHLIKILGVTEFTVNALAPLVTWFHTNFRVRSASSGEIPFHSALAAALETREGTPEEVFSSF